jgi:prepilin-type N-terminal cleavage/methylation domain-containing protein
LLPNRGVRHNAYGILKPRKMGASVTKKTERGFTTVELLITIAVVGILVPTLAGFINTLNRLNDRARDMSIINSLAENKVEGLRSIGFGGLSTGTTDFTSELPVTIGSPRSATYSITSPNSAIKQVDVTVTYNDHGTSRTLNYRTYVGELGVGQY